MKLGGDFLREIPDKSFYIGKNGKSYDSAQGLDAANQAYMSQLMPFIGRDGKTYGNLAALMEADRDARRGSTTAAGLRMDILPIIPKSRI